MAWSDPGDFTSGQILTAAQMDSIREAMFFGQGTFTTEAARDLAYAPAGAMSPITLQEGMRAYITASTITAAVGGASGTAAVPSGITTVYNGSNWVTVTEVGAYTSTSGTIAATGAFVTTLTGDATALSVTLQTGTSALITMSSTATHSVVGQGITQSVSVSGATTLAASVANGTAHTYATASGSTPLMRTILLTGLTGGTNTFTLNYLAGAATATMTNRALTVKGVA